MTSQKDLNKDMVALLSSVTDSIHQLRSEVVALRSDMNSQHMRNNNFNDRLINLEENKMKVIDEELKRIDMLETAFKIENFNDFHNNGNKPDFSGFFYG